MLVVKWNKSMQKNQLYYGDNLDVLKRYVNDGSVDLIYLDPPFNSRQDYIIVLFKEKDGTCSSSQIMAFEDTWEWNIESRCVRGVKEESKYKVNNPTLNSQKARV